MRISICLSLFLSLSCRTGKETEFPTPQIEDLTIDQEMVYSNSELLCVATVGDGQGGLIYSYRWTNGEGTEIGSFDAITLDASMVQPEDELTCTVTVRNSYDVETEQSISRIVQNTEPVVSEIDITPHGNIRTNDVLTCLASVLDVDGGEVRITYTWELSSISIISEGTEIDLGAYSINESSDLACVVEVEDAYGAIITERKIIDFLNTPPVIAQVEIVPNPASVDSDLSCDVQYIQSSNGESYSLSYEWQRNGTTLEETTLELSGPHSVHDVIACTAYINDGVQDGEPVRTELQIANDPPTITAVSISPEEAYVDTTLVCFGEGNDPNHTELTGAYRWTNAQGQIIGVQNILSLSPNMVSSGEDVTCSFSLFDPVGGEAEESVSRTILNTAPVITLLSLSSITAKVGDTVECMGTGEDIDGDTLSWSYRWYDSSGTDLGTESALVITTENSSPNEMLFCEATVGDGYLTEEESTPLFIENSEPLITSILLEPAPGFSNDSYHCLVETNDPDMDTVSLLYTWTVNQEVQSITGDTLYPPLPVDAYITCSAVPDDGGAYGAAQDTTTFVQNTDPEISEIIISPQEPINDSLLSCTVSAEDLDIDETDWTTQITIQYQWFDDAGLMISNEADLQLNPAFAHTGSTFTCEATAIDPQGASLSTTAEVTVLNSDPILVEEASIVPLTPVVGDTLSCSGLIEDAEDGELVLGYEWSNQDGTILGTESSLLLEVSNIDPEDVLTCSLEGNDAAGVGVTDSASVTILNTIPTIEGVSITPTTVYSDTTGISCVIGPVFDADDDDVDVNYSWYKNGALIQNENGEDLIITFTTDKEFKCLVTPNDGIEDGASSSVSITVANHDPVITSVTVSPSTGIYVGENLICSSSSTDLDGHSMNTTYRWFDVNGILLSTDSALLLTSTTTFPGDLHCHAIVDDGYGGVVESFTTVEVLNSLPEWSSEAVITLVDAEGDTTTSAYSGGTATCLAEADDADDGELTPTYSWRIAGIEIATGSTWVLDSSLSNVGDTLLCVSSVADSYEDTITSTTSITISNTPPEVTVSLSPDPATVVDSLTCTAVGIDPDDQTLSYSYRWVRNTSEEADWTEATISGLFFRDDAIECEVKAYDGMTYGDPVTQSLVISNALPVVESVVFLKDDVYTDDLISVVATGSDADEESFSFTYDWYKIDAQTSETTLVQSEVTNTLDGSLFLKDDVLYVEVFVTDETAVGSGLLSAELTILNTPPLAPTISIEPKFPLVDQALVCAVDVDSVDVDGDSRTYTVGWTLNGSEFITTETTTITGDTIATTELASSDKWVCTITPSDGTDDGDSADSYVTIGGGDLFDGTFGSTWDTLETSPSNIFSLMTYQSNDFSLLWNASGDYLSYYSPDADAWEYITTISPYTGLMKSMAPAQDMLYMVRNLQIYLFNPNTETWSTLNTYSGGDDLNQTTSDYQGRIYGHAATGEIIQYDIENNTVQQYPTGMGSLYETRISYDPISEALFFGAYNEDDLYRFDLNTQAVTIQTPIPEASLSTIFCGDRSGHLYAGGGYFGKTMYQYTIATDTWTLLPNLTFDHGNNGSCSVSEEGYLYVGMGSLLRLQRITLGMN